MKKLSTLLYIICIASLASAQSTLTLHDYSATTILGDTISLSQYYGQKVMVVNTASFCKFTPEFTQLEQLDSMYNTHNFHVIGFPCNDFGSQDPGTDSTINQFCTGIYGVKFQMMSKVSIITGDTAPVYKWLQRKNLNGVEDVGVDWNFNKFLIDEAGHWVRRVESAVEPLDTSITNWIMSPSVVNGVNSPAMDNMIQLISANPSASAIEFLVKTATAQKFDINIYSVDGRFINSIYNGPASNSEKISYSTASLPSGFYFVTVQSSGINKTFKLVVAR